MASSSAATPDTIVTIKVNIEGQNRRLKVQLRDLGASTLPDKLRQELQIPSSTDVLFERYSDSAAAFVTLDPNNSSVYKQLYRAAKAKLKLRIKATLIPKVQTSAHQATVEDEIPGAEAESTTVEVPQPTSTPRPTQIPQQVNAGPRKIVSLPVAHAPASSSKETPPSLVQLQRNFEDLKVSRSNRQSLLKDLDEIMNDVCSYKPLPAESTEFLSGEHHDYFADLPVIKLTRKAAKSTEVEKKVEMPEPSAMEMPFKKCPYAQANSSFTVFCNHCSRSISNVHYHCGVCDDGDFDLCMDCTGKGMACLDETHWMIKRTIEDGKVSSSTTETLAPKSCYNNSKTTLIETEEEEEEEEEEHVADDDATRTCNSCIQEFPETNFVTCTVCDDYDLCVPCHIALQHGHDPKHAFAPAVEDASLDPLAYKLLEPGRNAGHHAICDGCDKYIYGVRHKCLDCPDWDYCAACIVNATFIHPSHRFVPIYEPLGNIHESLMAHGNRVIHNKIYCDGPLCNATNKSNVSYIVGDRYKCAICHDTDFCAACEASPSNQHNKTHPLIKFKTMIHNVSVTTMGDHVDGQRMKVMGDRLARNASKATETNRSANAATQVQTVADLQPREPVKAEEVKPEIKEEVVPEVKAEIKSEAVKPEPVEVKEVKPEPVVVSTPVYEELRAHFVRDTVADGSVLPSNHVFEQTWVLRNSGNQVWPAGCSVKFVGGDNMCAIDPEHPASVRELASAAESNICQTEVAPGQEAAFTVLMRTPSRSGKIISYWRLTGPTGVKFGHKLWADVNVFTPVEKQVETPKAEVKAEEQSKMVFPKLEKESPTSSVHESAPAPASDVQESEADEFEDFLEEDEQDLDDETEDGFLTDEEYDILDASDEEFLADQSRGSKK
jgi:next-to-BRCA1 protein 1